jgi:IS5 family transposase
VFGSITHELRRCSAIEAAIGHMKTDGQLGRCYLKSPAGDAVNVILSAVGHNLRRVLAWLTILLRPLLIAIGSLLTIPTALFSAP